MLIRRFPVLMLVASLFVLGAMACSNENDDKYGYEENYEIKGAITGIVDSESFLLDNILVKHDSSTRFEHGNAEDLAVGKRVEIEGTRTASGVIIAREIEFENDD